MHAKLLFTVLLGMIIPAPASGQISIVGRVIDDVTELPLRAARVTVLAPDGSVLSRTETTETGTFEFEVKRVIRRSAQRYPTQL